MPPIPKKKAPVPKKQESPTVRLSITNDGMPSKQNRYPVALGGGEAEKESETPKTPNVRLAVTTAMTSSSEGSGKYRYRFHKDSPSVRLAHVPGAQGDNCLLGQRGVEALPDGSLPSLLVSYYYLEPFLENRHRYRYRDWVMDSGAFSAFNSGVEIKLQDYIDCCKRLTAEDPQLVEVYALDVIGDWKASLANAEEMWRQGVEAIPCFHYGEPWELLKKLAAEYPKIALGGCVGKRDKDKFAGQCFSRVWPKKIHGFGFGSEKSLLMYPWHSVDATNWEMGPCAYGRWNAFGGKLSVRGSRQNLRAEVEWYLELERKARDRWKKEMLKLEELEGMSPTIRLAQKQSGREEGKGLVDHPAIRLACAVGRDSQHERFVAGFGKDRENREKDDEAEVKERLQKKRSKREVTSQAKAPKPK